jgi:hypothetical protein
MGVGEAAGVFAADATRLRLSCDLALTGALALAEGLTWWLKCRQSVRTAPLALAGSRPPGRISSHLIISLQIVERKSDC